MSKHRGKTEVYLEDVVSVLERYAVTLENRRKPGTRQAAAGVRWAARRIRRDRALIASRDFYYPLKVVLICGSRDWTDYELIYRAIGRIVSYYGTLRLLFIVGGCRGADQLTERAAKAKGVHVARIDALWRSYPQSAGPMRNSMMISLEPDYVVAFHENIERSLGTADTVRQARRKGIPVAVITGRGKE